MVKEKETKRNPYFYANAEHLHWRDKLLEQSGKLKSILERLRKL